MWNLFVRTPGADACKILHVQDATSLETVRREACVPDGCYAIHGGRHLGQDMGRALADCGLGPDSTVEWLPRLLGGSSSGGGDKSPGKKHPREVQPQTQQASPPGSFALLASAGGGVHQESTVMQMTSFAGVLNQNHHWWLRGLSQVFTDRMTKSVVLDAVRELSSPSPLLGRIRLLYFLGHGVESGSGDWQLADGSVSFSDVLSLWRRHNPLESYKQGNVLYMYADCCCSGQWVDACQKLAPPDVYLQTAGDSKDCCGGYWLRAHADKQDEQPVLAYRHIPRVYIPPTSTMRRMPGGILDVRALLHTFVVNDHAPLAKKHKSVEEAAAAGLKTNNIGVGGLAMGVTAIGPAKHTAATTRSSASDAQMDVQYAQWDALQRAAAHDKAGTSEAQFRQAIASKDRTIVALLADKEDLKLQLEDLRHQLKMQPMQMALATGLILRLTSCRAVYLTSSNCVSRTCVRIQKAVIHKFKEGVHDAVVCPVCHEPTPVPRVIECGHMVCEPCLKSWDAASNPLPLGVVVTSATPQARTLSNFVSRRILTSWRTLFHHTNRKCPLCRALLVGPGYKCFNLRALTKGLISHLRDEASASSKETKDEMNVEYEQDSNERRALIDLRIKYLKQVEMGEFAAQQFALLLTREQQMQGVLVFFHPTCTHAFLQSFGTYLVRVHGYDVQYDVGGRVLTLRLLLQATVVVRPPLGSGATTATAAAHAVGSSAVGGASDCGAPQLVVTSAAPITNNADLYRYGIQVMPDRRIVILPAPPLSASGAAAAAAPAGGAADDDEDDEPPATGKGPGDATATASFAPASSTTTATTAANAPHLPPPVAPSQPIEETIQVGPIPLPVDSSEAAALLSGVRAVVAVPP